MLIWCVFLLLLFPGFGDAKMSILPLFNGYGAFGNVFYNEKSGAADFNYDLDFVPVLVLSERTSILPRIGSKYTGTLLPKEIQEEGNIYLQLLDTTVSFKYLHKRESGWTYRAEFGLKKELTREAVDETWDKGLYDFQTNHLDLGVEKKFKFPLSIGTGLRTFTTLFPNYKSLSSEQGQELVGSKVLDTSNTELYLKTEYLLGRTFFRATINSLQSDYPDQKTVTMSGEYSTTKRHDTYTDLSLGISYLLPEIKMFIGGHFKTFLGINFSSRNRISNQNHFDAERFYFSERYYDYAQNIVTPSLTIRFLPSNWELSLAYDTVQKKYIDRVIQDQDGNYSTSATDKLYQNSRITNLRVTFPLFKKFQMYLTGSYRTAESNMMYQKFFQYNYVTYSYLMGISYQY